MFKGFIGEGVVIKCGECSMVVVDFKSVMKWLLVDVECNVLK